jgi:hypothetical protein
MNDEELLNSFNPDTLRLVSDFTSKVWNRGMLYESGAKATPENIARIDSLNIELLQLIKDDRRFVLNDFAEYCHARYKGCTMDEYAYDGEVVTMAEDYLNKLNGGS